MAETPSAERDRLPASDRLDESRNHLQQLSLFGGRAERGLMKDEFAGRRPLRKVGRINGPGDFDKLTAGFKRMRCVTYVATTADVLRSYDHGLESMELVLGYRLEDSAETAMKNDMRQGDATALDKLVSLYQSRRLLPLVPKRREHSKYYILEDDERIRFVFTSYNLSGSHQGNLYVLFDYAKSEEDGYRDLLELYESVKAGCTEFSDLRSLAEHVGDEVGGERAKAIQVWVTAESETEEDEDRDALSLTIADIVGRAVAKVREVLDESTSQNMDIKVNLPADLQERKKLLDATRGWSPKQTSADEITFDAGLVAASAYVVSGDARKKTQLVVNWPSAWIRRDLRLVVGFHGEQRIRTADEMDQDAIRRGLKNIERYIETVERGQTRNVKVRERAKAMMGETLLHMFAAPFLHEWNKRKRRAYPRLAEGPPDLVVTGGSGNGKTRFAEYCLKLMVGEAVPLLDAPDTLSRSKVRKAIPRVLSFPLVFDEVHGKTLASKDVGSLIRSLWEAWWGPDRETPVLVFLGNDLERKDWMVRRVKFVDYEVHFPPKNEDNERLLGSLFAETNDIYRYFTRQYIEEERREAARDFVSLDALYTARQTIRALYRVGGLGDTPKYFLDKPVEEEHDIGRERWLEAIEHGQIKMAMAANPWFADFEPDMEKQIDEYRGYLRAVKHRREGRRLILEVPDTVCSWFGNGDPQVGKQRLLEAVRTQERQTKPRGLRGLFSRRSKPE